MKNLNLIAEELFNKIRGRFPSVTIGTEKGEVTNKPSEARFYDFDFKEGEKVLGKVSISLDEDNVAVMYSNDLVTLEDEMTKDSWYNFLKELRVFAKKRLLNFDTRDINKSNLDRRDYKFLAQNRPGEITMEAKMYGTSKTSYQNVGTARIAVKHTAPINQESLTGRSSNLGSIYVESAEGERFKYPFKHLNGARAMARHVAEGGKPYDDFGKHIVSMSEELGKLKKFKTYMNRSAVMAEGLAGYLDVVNERIQTVKKSLEQIQKESYYKAAFESFEVPMMEDVPEDVAENWIDQLTIKQFNEELKDVFPYIYKLVSEATKAKELDIEGLLDEAGPVDKLKIGQPAETYKVQPGDTLFSIAKKFQDANFQGADIKEAVKEIMMLNKISNPKELQVGQVIEMPYFMGSGPDGAGRGLPPGGFKKYESELESAFEEMLGQFAEGGITLTKPGEEPAADAHTMDKQVAMNKDMSQQSAGKKDLGDGFELVDTEVAGQKVKGVRDTQSGSTIVINKGIVRSPGKYIVVDKNGKMTTAMKVGPMSTQAVKKAGLEEADAAHSKKSQVPLGEFILSYFDRETGKFPKGETAVLTMVEKDYGEGFITPAKKFIEQVGAKFSEIQEKQAGITFVPPSKRTSVVDPDYEPTQYSDAGSDYDEYANEFDELKALMKQTTFSNDQLMRRNALMKKYGVKKTSDNISGQEKDYFDKLNAKNAQRKADLDASNAKASAEYRQDMMKLAPEFFNPDGTPNIAAWKAAGSPTPSEYMKRKSMGSKESIELDRIKGLAGL